MIFLIFFFIKSILFINLTEIHYESIKIIIIMVMFFLSLSFVILSINSKRRGNYLKIFYALVSILMFIDTVYFGYFNSLPSLVMLRQMGAASKVLDSVGAAISIKHILFLIDLPFLFIFNKINILKDNFIYKFIDKNKALILLVSSSIWGLLVLGLNVNGLGSILEKQELFSYHTNDLYNCLIVKDKEVDFKEIEKSIVEKDVKDLKVHKNIEQKIIKYNGVAKGKNLIVIQVEGFQNFVVNKEYNGKEITPNFNKLISENGNIYFNNYYQLLGRGNTSDAEFVSHNSLFPSMEDTSYSQYVKNRFYGLPYILKDNGYSATAFHGYKKEFWNRSNAYPNQGFDLFYSEKDYKLDEVLGMGLADKSFLNQSIDKMTCLNEPFYSFLVTLTSHTPFDKNYDRVRFDLKKEHKNTMFGHYLSSINYTDEAIGEFINNLKKKGLYENSVLVIYGDHFALSCMNEENKKIMNDYLGREYDYDEMMNIPLLIHIPSIENRENVEIVGSQMDFLPTILNLFGIKNQNGIMFGQDLLNAEKGFVAEQTYMLKGSFIDDEKVFVMSRDGIFEHSRAFLIKNGESVNINKCVEGYKKAIEMIDKSDYILKNDYLNHNLKKNRIENVDYY